MLIFSLFFSNGTSSIRHSTRPAASVRHSLNLVLCRARTHQTTQANGGYSGDAGMNNQPTIRHKTYSIQLVSYRRKIGWIPKATVRPPEGDTKGHTIAGNPKDLLPTQEAADVVAKKLAFEWIDAQFPSAAD